MMIWHKRISKSCPNSLALDAFCHEIVLKPFQKKKTDDIVLAGLRYNRNTRIRMETIFIPTPVCGIYGFLEINFHEKSLIFIQLVFSTPGFFESSDSFHC